MKKIIVVLAAVSILSSCTSENDFNKGKRQLEQQGYTNIKNTGHSWFGCSDDDTYSSGFEATDNNGNKIKGAFCSGVLKGITIRFQ
jgi:hypothetical protein